MVLRIDVSCLNSHVSHFFVLILRKNVCTITAFSSVLFVKMNKDINVPNTTGSLRRTRARF